MKCYVLGKELGELYCEHHFIKREHGGENKGTVYLSPNIHDALHRSEHNKVILDETLAKLTPDQQRRFLKLYKLLEVKIGDRGYKSVKFNLDNSTYDKLKLIASNQNLSVNKLIKKLLEEKL